MSSLINENISPKLLKEYKKSFDFFDVNKNGFIDRKEMQRVLKELNQDSTKAQVNRVFKVLGRENCKEITFDDFVSFLIQFQKNTANCDSNDEMIQAFQAFDKDHNGYISLSEFKQALTILGHELSPKEQKEIFSNADLNKDGYIDYYEFVQFWKNQ